jgi:hypothetical protein
MSPSGGRPTPPAQAPSGLSLFGAGIDPGLGLPVMAWSLTTALGVVLFAIMLRRPSRLERVPAGAPSGGSPGAVATAAATIQAPISWGGGPAEWDEDVDPSRANAAGPSSMLRGQRQAGEPGMLPAPRQPERFESPPRAGSERRTIGYRLVRLSDGPDGLRSRELARLDRGDEVEIVGEADGALKVRTPSGLEGWVPRVAIVG